LPLTQELRIPFVLIEKKSAWEILQDIANLCCAYVYADRRGRIIIQEESWRGSYDSVSIDNITTIQNRPLAQVPLPQNWRWERPTTSVGNEGIRQHVAIHNGSTHQLNVRVVTLRAVVGTTLSEVRLPHGWEWIDPTALVGVIGTRQHVARFDNGQQFNLPIVVVGAVTALVPVLTAFMGEQLSSVLLPLGWEWMYPTIGVGGPVQVSHNAIFNGSIYSLPIQINLRANVGQRLEEIKLPSRWTWQNPTTSVGAAGTRTHNAIFGGEVQGVRLDVTASRIRPRNFRKTKTSHIRINSDSNQSITENGLQEYTHNARMFASMISPVTPQPIIDIADNLLDKYHNG